MGECTGGGSFTQDFERQVKKALETECLYGSSVRGTQREGCFTGNYFERYVRKSLEMEHLSLYTDSARVIWREDSYMRPDRHVIGSFVNHALLFYRDAIRGT